MSGKLVFVGGDEFRAGCRSMDSHLLALPQITNVRVLIVPAAAADSRPEMAAENGVEYFHSLGAHASSAMVLQPSDAEDNALISSVDDADIVYFTGGNPIHVLNVLDNSSFLRRLKRFLYDGGILAGSSAGAMVMGGWMKYRGWVKGLSLIEDVVILPHHENSNPVDVSIEFSGSMPDGIVALGIDSGTACVIDVETSVVTHVLGQGQVLIYDRVGWNEISVGDSLNSER